MDFVKYPKTLALDRIQPALTWADIDGQNYVLVVEEKMDGTQLGLQFDAQAQPVFQSRGTVISSEVEFAWIKAWAWEHYDALYERLGQRYIMFGEWLWAKHTVFYDQLPHYWMEFDIYDREQKKFLSTAARQRLLTGLDFIHSMRVIDTLQTIALTELWVMVGRSAFISEQAYQTLDADTLVHTDTSGLMEGLYLKVEDQYQVVKRYKLIRPEFVRLIVGLGEHWRKRDLVRNGLAE